MRCRSRGDQGEGTTVRPRILLDLIIRNNQNFIRKWNYRLDLKLNRWPVSTTFHAFMSCSCACERFNAIISSSVIVIVIYFSYGFSAGQIIIPLPRFVWSFCCDHLSISGQAVRARRSPGENLKSEKKHSAIKINPENWCRVFWPDHQRILHFTTISYTLIFCLFSSYTAFSHPSLTLATSFCLISSASQYITNVDLAKIQNK